MSRQHTVTQIDARAMHLLPGSSRVLLVRRGEEGRGVHDELARKEWAVADQTGDRPVSRQCARGGSRSQSAILSAASGMR